MESYIQIEGKTLKEDWNKLREENDIKFSEDTDNEELQSIVISDLTDDSVYFNEKNQSLEVSLDSKYGFGYIEFKVSDDLIFEMIEHLKQKGEKIKRLVNLAE
jgi:hypothetical protein